MLQYEYETYILVGNRNLSRETSRDARLGASTDRLASLSFCDVTPLSLNYKGRPLQWEFLPFRASQGHRQGSLRAKLQSQPLCHRLPVGSPWFEHFPATFPPLWDARAKNHRKEIRVGLHARPAEQDEVTSWEHYTEQRPRLL